ncbi:hypothetical protein BD770DRAFT_416479, partial [Pilaira anomala]
EIQEQYEARATARRERDLRRYRARANARQYASRTDYERSMRGRDYERGLNTGESSSSEEEETNGDDTDFSFSDSDDDYEGLSTELTSNFVINAVSGSSSPLTSLNRSPSPLPRLSTGSPSSSSPLSPFRVPTSSPSSSPPPTDSISFIPLAGSSSSSTVIGESSRPRGRSQGRRGRPKTCGPELKLYFCPMNLVASVVLFRRASIVFTFTCEDTARYMKNATGCERPWEDPILFANHFRRKWNEFFGNIY